MRFIFLLLPLFLSAQILKVADSFDVHAFNDQNETECYIKENQQLVISWDKETTALANEYFAKHGELIKENKVSLLVDLSQAPQGILSLFILPRLRSYNHTILLSYDEVFNRTLPYKEGFLTLLSLKAFKLSGIAFVDDFKGLEALLNH